ncbi:hypothetical protein ACQP2Y_33140 [Actinoplanes sp. CA-051413]|uniref:hypothetical protein n=1 Tax=Actinoplanes sp. CA-051413 TaxID=3239899 RepID=UPI003D979917
MRWSKPPPPPEDPTSRFGSTCPVCRQLLGAAQPPLDPETGRFMMPPSFRLEVGAPDGRNGMPWRVTMLAGNYRPAESLDPAFNQHEVDFVYLLCGGGHIFPDATPVFRAGPARRPDEARQNIDEWNMVAAMGAPASGKTYLLVRTLKQNLDNLTRWDAQDDPGRIRLRKLSPLEELPLTSRISKYNDTRQTGEAIQPTGTDGQATPAGMLQDQLRDALAAIQELVRRTVVDGERRAQQWGKQFRQPLVVRTDSAGRRTWTGVADLPGELFDEHGTNRREAGMLRSFDALLWVVDPAVAPNAPEWMATESVAEERLLLDGSLRPGTVKASGADIVRGNRESIQDDIGLQITMVDGLFATNEGRPLQMLVAISKCDLIRAALEKPGLDLRDIGAPGEVERGTATYLSVAMDRWSRGAGADPGATQLLTYIWGAHNPEPAVRQRRAVQVARGLLDHFSQPEEFWKLVHVGTDNEVSIPRGDMTSEVPQHVRVPSIDEHLDSALQPGSGALILLRDLIMSAVGCGLAYGLGQQSALFRMHREPWITLRFFLCSPLATVPIAVDDIRLKPLNPRDRFPRVDDRAAALTQLLLAVLGRARR